MVTLIQPIRRVDYHLSEFCTEACRIQATLWDSFLSRYWNLAIMIVGNLLSDNVVEMYKQTEWVLTNCDMGSDGSGTKLGPSLDAHQLVTALLVDPVPQGSAELHGLQETRLVHIKAWTLLRSHMAGVWLRICLAESRWESCFGEFRPDFLGRLKSTKWVQRDPLRAGGGRLVATQVKPLVLRQRFWPIQHISISHPCSDHALTRRCSKHPGQMKILR